MIVLPLIRGVELALVERFSASRFWGELDRSHGARIAWGGGCPREIWRPFEERFGVEVRERYGMTECTSITTANLDGTLGSAGRPVPWFDVKIRTADGQPAGLGGQGEIVVTTRLPGALTSGHIDNPEATSKALRQGAFQTDDLGSWDAAGNLNFHGRMSDSARVKGENVSAFEVESVAAKHPAVEDCAIIPVAAEIGEQDIELFVKPRPGPRLWSTVYPRGWSRSWPPINGHATSQSSPISIARRASAS